MQAVNVATERMLQWKERAESGEFAVKLLPQILQIISMQRDVDDSDLIVCKNVIRRSLQMVRHLAQAGNLEALPALYPLFVRTANFYCGFSMSFSVSHFASRLSRMVWLVGWRWLLACCLVG